MHLLSLALPTLFLGVVIAGQSDNAAYLGCFSDPADSRVFEFGSSDSAMTAEVCSGLCSGSTFYGTQYGTECWCGNNEDYDANGDGFCDISCSGDSDEICGGFYSMTVYENLESDYLGCYSDPADDRVFERIASSDDMTAAVCLGHCGAYQYYGTQYSTECWCGNNANYGANGDGVCDMSCSGNSGEVCGGFYSMSVYENPDYVWSSEDNYRGCYSDPADWRDWVTRGFVQSDSSSAMTPELCASQCSDSAFYGTQYSNECWCGDYNARYSSQGEGVCDMPCSGDPDETCGGYYSMDVYASDPAYIGCAQDSMD
ncbi:unnamed protein product, partial [Ectocarpus sp. 6 AP-2014]